MIQVKLLFQKTVKGSKENNKEDPNIFEESIQLEDQALARKSINIRINTIENIEVRINIY